MQLVELKEFNREEYNNFVAANEGGSFLQAWEWGEWQSALGRQVERLKFKVESGETVAVMQFVKMPLPMGKYYVYCPYGPVLSEKFKVQSEKLLQEMQKKFLDAVFIRIEPKEPSFIFHSSSFIKSPNIQPGKTLVIDLNKSDEQLLSEMHHKTRYNIRLAEKHGVEITDEFHLINGKGIQAREAVDLIARTSGRQGYKSQGVGYFEKLVNFFALHNPSSDLKIHIYKALYNKELLASAIIIDFAKTRTYLFGGSSDSNKNIMAPYLLHWRAMLDAKAAGLSAYDFWGIETAKGDTPGFVRFKLGFTSLVESIKEYAGAYDIIAKPFLYKVYTFGRWLSRLVRG
jgi:lipid II:glycine glycyltransferase (peptidoglycan interpeptide bridge formation enzyme)